MRVNATTAGAQYDADVIWTGSELAVAWVDDSKVITTAVSFWANVLILTLIGSDLVIAGLDRARGQTDAAKHLVDDSNVKLAAFANET